jgi:hypothetical protein
MDFTTTPTGYVALDRLLGLRPVWKLPLGLDLINERDALSIAREFSWAHEIGGFAHARLTVLDGLQAPTDLLTTTPGAVLWDGEGEAPVCSVAVIMGAPEDKNLPKIQFATRRCDCAVVVVAQEIKTKGLKFYAYQRVTIQDGRATMRKDALHGAQGASVTWPEGELLT